MQSSQIKYWAPLLAASLAMFIVVVDSTMMNVAVPTIVNDLGTTVTAVQSVIALYSLVMAALMLTGGKLGAIIGIRKAFSIGVALYGAGTLLAAFSWNINVLAFGWALLEGIGAALLIPAAFTVLVANYKDSDRALAFGILAGVQASAAAVGPILGGVLTTYLSWRWGFGGQVIIVLTILPLIPLIQELDGRERKEILDWGGAALSSLGMLILVSGFLLAGRYGWWEARRVFECFGVELHLFGLSPTPILIVTGLGFLVAFFHWQTLRESRGDVPLVPLRIFSNLPFVTGASMFTIRSTFLTGLLFVLPLYMQAAIGFTAFQCGLALLPFSASVFVVSLTTANWSNLIAPRSLIQIGLVLLALGTLYMHMVTSLEMTIGTFVLPVTVMGIGLGFVMAQLVNLTLSSVDPEATSEASGVNNALSELGNSFGTAVIGSLLLSFYFSNVVDQMARRADITLSYTERNAIILELEDARDVETEAGQQSFMAELSETESNALTHVIEDSQVLALQETLIVIVCLILITILLSTFLPGRRAGEQEAKPTTG